MAGETGAGDSPSIRMMALLYGSIVGRLVSVVAEFGVADLCADGPRDVDDLAAAVDADPDTLHRMLRALAGAGVFSEVAPRTFALTELAATLRRDVPGSMRDHARNWGSSEYLHTIVGLGGTLRTGRPSFDTHHGVDWWSYLGAHPRRAQVFDRAMGNRARQIGAAAVAACDLSGVRRLVDVGGGQGHLVAAVVDRYPGIHAVVYDRPDVVAGAPEVVGERAEAVGGDFFTSVPPGADCYVLSSVLHDWEDDDAVTILRTVRAAMDPAGRLLVLETVLPEGDEPHMGKLLDVLMLALVGGRERTEREYAALLERADLRIERIVPTATPVGVLVAAPA
ncbi:hydroxyneurosporene-O-methyltransferase [Actinomycetospora succinea]|uniref:Hydroxyneurosporene-O-methyltransferase n=1 Tax=Actinomycetospora succinea TaxID=663603 RepID=A0A4R6V9M1_9PSEU|nr:methyltransferase [Actinomycetospora succinea]TDQ55899.1 hydroxyneurosporene-O-methyltransferase [Actinomycetospora succinea]